ncbi:hypothetical protein Ate01nite_03610 [Actinoplanes teichomyceticus]|nr:hypothetical protein Ate01nite_03610 [Actinoplanes teichomyceticus]
MEVSSTWSAAAIENRTPIFSSMNAQSHRMQAPPAEAAGTSATVTGGSAAGARCGLPVQPDTASKATTPSTAETVRTSDPSPARGTPYCPPGRERKWHPLDTICQVAEGYGG